MGFQTAVNVELGAGLPGTLYDDGPVRAAPYELNSAQASYNVIGATAFTVVSGDPGNNAASGVVAAGGTGSFAGILMNPKVYANYGTTAGPLTSNLTLPNFTIGELLTMGDIWVSLPGPANVGDLVCYDQTTGQLSAYPRQNQFTAALATTGVLTVTAITVGQIQVGSIISGTGVPGGTYVTANISGTGGAGTYQTSAVNTSFTGAIAAEAMTGTSLPPTAAAFTGEIATTGILTVSAITSGELAPGQIVYGTGITPNPVILSQVSGTVGSTGNYSINQVPASAIGATAMTTDQQVGIPRAEVYRFAPAGNPLGNGLGIGVIKITD
jgi:hypothetical protein